MVQVETVHKTFRGKKRKKTEVLKGISFTAEPGSIFGLLGPNGAGKTTTLRIIATLLKADQGRAYVNGMDVTKESRKVRNSIGFLTSDMKLTGNLSPRELVTFFGRLNKLDQSTINQRLTTLSEYLDMGDFLDKPVEKLSTGMCQKASIAVALIHDPQIIIFDEPTNGLDILAAKTVVDFLMDYRKQGKTVIVSTHIMTEAEKLCDRIGIILNGELVTEGTQDELKARYAQQTLEDVFFHLAAAKGVTQNA